LGEGSVAQVEFVKNEMFQSKIKPKPGTEFVVDAGLVLKAVGYKVLPLAGVDYDSKNFVIANGQGRVNDHGLYVAGWAADGPSGIIGTNKTRARKVVTEIVKDLPQIKSRHSNKTLDFNLGEFLAGRGVRFVSKEEWQQIDKFEITRGVEQQRVRERFICSQEMLEFLR
jgi:ferredoxin--NADP+ reductase